MHEDSSSQFSGAPPVDSLFSTRAKLGRGLSWLLVVSGIGLIGMGGWMYWQRWQEVNHPPARILEVSLAEAEQTLTPAPSSSPTPAAPTATALLSGDRREAAVTPSPTASPLPLTTTPTTVSLPPTATGTPPQIRVAEAANPAATFTSEPTAPPAAAPTIAAAMEAAAEADVPSLADFPLLVVEDEALAGEASPPQPAAPAAMANTGAAALTRIVAESIGLAADVINVGWQTVEQNGVRINVWTVADYAAGWHNNSMLPGQSGNIVISGHHNIKGEVFRYIVDLEPGEIISLYDAAGAQHDYLVEDKFIVKDKGEPDAVRQANARWIGPFNEERLTLITCWPYTNNTHRVIVIAKPAGQAQAAN